MIFALILAGGVGTRLTSDIPKQYIEVNGRPIISYCLERFQKHNKIDKIVIVAVDYWFEYLSGIVDKENVTKFIGLAEAGKSRQHSILNGLKYIKNNGGNEQDIVIIHDAARPNVSDRIISSCVDLLVESDGAMPVLAVKDTVYVSEDGKRITKLLNRDKLFAGQAPESFRFGKYYEANMVLTDDELMKTRGSSEIAYRADISISMFSGDESNYKITTSEDLDKFINEQE